MDKKVFLAITLCAGIYLLWQSLFIKPLQQAQQQSPQEQQAVATTLISSTPAAPLAAIGAKKNTPTVGSSTQEKILGDSAYNVTISTHGGIIRSVHFPEYRGQKIEGLS